MVKRSESAPLDFKGFSAFADHTSVASAAVQMSRRRSSSTLNNNNNNLSSSTATASITSSLSPAAGTSTSITSSSSSQHLRPSPIYLGNDPQIIILFRSIGQKKDATTKIRSMVELSSLVFPITYHDTDDIDDGICTTKDIPNSSFQKRFSSNNNKNSNKMMSNYTIENPPGHLKKSDLILVLSHFYYLFQTKLIHDNNPLVRLEAIQVIRNAMLHVPKAFYTLAFTTQMTSNYRNSVDNEMDSSTSNHLYEQYAGLGIGNVIGYIYTAKCLLDSTVSPIASITFSRMLNIGKERWNHHQQQEQQLGVKECLKQEGGGGHEDGNDDADDIDSKRFICNYILRHIEAIMHFSSRPVILNDALMGKVNQNTHSISSHDTASTTLSGKNTIKKSTSSIDYPTTVQDGGDTFDKEEVEERYERTVISSLKALCTLLQEYPETSFTHLGDDGQELLYSTLIQSPTLLWKHMNSTRGNFRRETYNIISSACQHALSLVHSLPFNKSTSNDRGPSTLQFNTKIQALMTQALVSEREISNFPALFEMLLVYIHSWKQMIQSVRGSSGIDAESTLWDELKLDTLVKALVKPLKHACYGSAANQWGPILLPIIACMPNQLTLKLPIVKNLWEGCSATTVRVDKLAIVSAVAEICGYLLSCKTVDDSKDSDAIKESTQLLTESLSFYLMEPSLGSSSMESSKTLCRILSKVLVKLDKIPSYDDHDGKHCFLYVQSFFWSEGISTVWIQSSLDDDSVMRLNALINNLLVLMVDSRYLPGRCSDLLLSFKSVFRNCMTLPQGHWSDIKIQLFCNIFTLCGVKYILSDDDDNNDESLHGHVETFVMNTMLTWLIPRVSSTSVNSPNQATHKAIFSLLFLILLSIENSEVKKLLWEALLNELIKAGVQLDALTGGLSVLISLAEERGILEFSSVVIRSSVLNSFALHLSQCVMMSNCDEAVYSSRRISSAERANFLSFHGLDGEDMSNKNLYRDFMSLTLGLSPHFLSTPIISAETVKDIATLFAFLRDDSSLEKGQLILLELLLESCFVGKLTDEDDVQILLLTAWKQGGGIWDMAKVQIVSSVQTIHCVSVFIAGCFNGLLEILSRPFSFDGTSSLAELWSQRAWRLYEICMRDEHRTKKFARLSGIGNVTLWISTTNNACTGRRDFLYRCLNLFLKSFEQSIDRCMCLVGQNDDDIEFMAVLLSALCVPVSSYWSPSIVSRCKELYSLLHASKNLPRSFHCSVAFCLLDSLCTKLEDVSISETETVCLMTALDFVMDHLVGKIVYDDASVPIHRLTQDGSRIIIDQELASFINDIESQMCENIIKRYLTPPDAHETMTSIQLDIASETCNLVLSRCGLPGKAGLGSRKYELFLTLTSMCDRVKNSLSAARIGNTDSNLLRHLSQAMGYGRMTAPSRQNVILVNLDYKSLSDVIAIYINEYEFTIEFCSALVMFTSTVSHLIESDKSHKEKTWNILDRVSKFIFEIDDKNEEFYFCLLLLKAIDTMKTSQFDTVYYSKPCLVEVRTRTRLLLTCSRNMNHHNLQDQNKTPLQEVSSNFPHTLRHISFQNMFDAFLDDILSLPEDVIVTIWQACVEDMYTDIYSCFQWKLFNLFMVGAKNGDQLYTETACLSKKISTRLDQLSCKIMSEGESDELKEDFLVAAKWLPRSLMIDLESWDDECETALGDDTAVSRFLIWLLFLEILDNASRTDIRNRSHLSSYIETTNATSVIMDLVLSCATFQEKDGSEWMTCISSTPHQSLRLSQLASLTAFRSFESIPTLMKRWYNETCPRSMQSSIAKFVETKVSAHTLKRELDRLKRAENLSDLVINGSNVSREVSATYLQDECQLSVLIHIPSLFPLKNVEVDCKKTYGVSEKRWRHWSLQIMRMLNSQDGSILDALLLWKKSVDKEFEGVEPCPVCYSVLSVKTHSMPNIECKTCHNRFHNHCLFKWFESSGKNLCVLCQQPWSGTRIS